MRVKQPRDLRCRVILEQIKDYNQFPEDQGLSALGLAMVMKETTGMLQDDVRLVAARGKLLKDAIKSLRFQLRSRSGPESGEGRAV